MTITPAVAVSTRPAAADDIDFLSDAHRAGQAGVAEARGGTLDTLLKGRAEPIEDSFMADLDNEGTFVWVAEADSLPVGYLVATEVALRSAEIVLRVVDLWVHPDARGIGLGSALMNNALAVASERDAIGVDARALPGDRVTKNFFETFGLKARTIEVFREL